MTEQPEDQISETLLGVIEPGTSWIVRGISNDVLVEPYDVTHDNPRQFPAELVARTDALNERLSNIGGGFGLWTMLTVVVICVGIHLDWFAAVLGKVNPYLQSIWFYLAALTVTFFGLGLISQVRENALYRRHREKLMQELNRHGVRLVDYYVRIKDDDELESLVKRLRLDPAFLEDQPAG